MNNKESASDWYPYFKQNRIKHDSGYRCFDMGYLREKGGVVVESKLIGTCSDHIYFSNIEELFVNFDIMHDGKIRIHNNFKQIRWMAPFTVSTMHVEEGLPHFLNSNPNE